MNEAEKQKAAFLKMLDDEPPFEKHAHEAEMKALEGTIWEWAQMQADGNIEVKVWEYGVGGSRGDGGYIMHLDEEDYAECRDKYDLKKPGDTYSVRKRLINGEWIVQEDKKPPDVDPLR